MQPPGARPPVGRKEAKETDAATAASSRLGLAPRRWGQGRRAKQGPPCAVLLPSPCLSNARPRVFRRPSANTSPLVYSKPPAGMDPELCRRSIIRTRKQKRRQQKTTCCHATSTNGFDASERPRRALLPHRKRTRYRERERVVVSLFLQVEAANAAAE